MSDEPTSPIRSPDRTQDPENNHNHKQSETRHENGTSNHVVARRERPSRACTARAAARLSAAVAAETTVAARKPKKAKKEPVVREEEPPSPPPQPQCKIVTQLVAEPLPEQLPRWNIRSMSELGSILNFLNVFRPLLNIKVEFSAEEFETALITPNKTLGDVHMPLLKAIPPVTRMALGHNTWITVLCRKLRDWWHWVAEGEIPIVASHGTEVEAYNALDPAVRVVILKALCDIRVEQEDIRNYIDDSIKHGAPLSSFRKERVGGDSYGISYWYEEDPIIGHRLYREIRRVEVKKAKGKNVPPIPNSSYEWETVATNLDEFQDVSEKLFSSVNRTEASLGKKLKNDMLEEIEKVHKRKERQLKKQQREGLLLDSMINVDGLVAGRSLRDRKPVTYTFDDYDRSINEAIKITKQKPPSPETSTRREMHANADTSLNGTTDPPRLDSFNVPSPMSSDYDDEAEMDHKREMEMPSNRRRQRPQRYSAREYVETVSENEADSDSDDDIVGEVVYDDEYLKQRKRRRKDSSGSEEEYRWDGDNLDDDEEEEEEDDDDDSDASASMSEDSDRPRRKLRKAAGPTRRGTKVRSVGELQSGLRRSRRATRNRIDYKQYEASDSEGESRKPGKSNASDDQTDPGEDDEEEEESSMGSQDFEGKNDEPEIEPEPELEVDLPEQHEAPETVEKEQDQPMEKPNGPVLDFDPAQDGIGGFFDPAQDGIGGGVFDDAGQEENGGVRKPRFLDLNELAPGSGFEDGPSMNMDDDDDDDTNNF